MSFIFSLCMVLYAIALSAAMAFAPTFSSPATPLGVKIPKERSHDPAVTQALSGYRHIIVLAGAIASVIMLPTWKFPILAGFATTFIVMASLFAYAKQRTMIIAAKREGKWFDDIETTIAGQVAQPRFNKELGKLSTPHVPWLWLLGSLAAILTGIAVTAYRWADIPETIPTHWGSGMQPDAWSDKSIGTVFFGAFIALGLLVLFAALTSLIAWSSVHVRSDQTIRGAIRNRANMAAANRGMGLLLFGITVPLMFLQICSAIPSYQHAVPLITISLIIITVICVPIMLVMIYNAQSSVEELVRHIDVGETSTLDSPDNDKFYKWGVFYNNPDDPALFVDRRFGVGFGFNYAHWQTKTFLAAIILSVIGLIALAVFL
ncbi:DUF5808 domain-containing protein [Corynebacterium anserum]|uniref:DUF1648 domain-containing protein n=1 Tax=Corynebacterium anserum TaxID=2684406 RepID=A0A7G7YQ58_9CORY|nr:DUF5808 domain-containing protein [Corynebacterium anserum]QNH96628.1 DUF1648 domain-containing protein [Corynebacterium anserum]